MRSRIRFEGNEVSSRPFVGKQDMAPLRRFLTELRRDTGPTTWHVGDLTWRFFLHAARYGLSQTVRLWLDQRGLLGFAIRTPGGRACDGAEPLAALDFQVSPRGKDRGVVQQMVAWGVGHLATDRVVPDKTDSRTGLTIELAYKIEADLRSLEDLGFRRGDRQAVLLTRSLTQPVRRAPMSEGFSVRLLQGEREAAERSAAHRDTFGSTRLTEDRYRALMKLAEYRRALDVVAVSPEGTIASFALVWHDEVNHEVLFEPVGTRPAFRRLGLSRAVLSEGLIRARALGADRAVVGPVDWTETAALELYDSLGFGHAASAVELVLDPSASTERR